MLRDNSHAGSQVRRLWALFVSWGIQLHGDPTNNELDRSKIFACYFDVDSSPCDTVRIDRPTMDGHVGLEPQESIKFALANRNA